jgi:hypothetical protein
MRFGYRLAVEVEVGCLPNRSGELHCAQQDILLMHRRAERCPSWDRHLRFHPMAFSARQNSQALRRRGGRDRLPRLASGSWRTPPFWGGECDPSWLSTASGAALGI